MKSWVAIDFVFSFSKLLKAKINKFAFYVFRELWIEDWKGEKTQFQNIF